MMIDEDLLGLYIDAHGSWPQSFVWVFLTLMQQRMELEAEQLMDLWFGSDEFRVEVSSDALCPLIVRGPESLLDKLRVPPELGNRGILFIPDECLFVRSDHGKLDLGIVDGPMANPLAGFENPDKPWWTKRRGR